MQYIVAIRIFPASFVGLKNLFLPSRLLPIPAPSQSFLLSPPLAQCLGALCFRWRYSSSTATSPNPAPPFLPTSHPNLPSPSRLLQLQIIENLVWGYVYWCTCHKTQILIVIGKTFKKFVIYFLVSTNLNMFILLTTFNEINQGIREICVELYGDLCD